MQITPDAWLSRVLERPCYNVTDITADDPIESIAAKEPRSFWTVKIPTDQVALVHRFENIGFRVVDTQVTFVHRENTGLPSQHFSGFTLWTQKIIEDIPERLWGYSNIAAQEFFSSRFHLDPNLWLHKANEIKRAWAISYYQKTRGDMLWVASDERGEAIGFLGAEPGVIDLIAVDKKWQQKGVGRALVIAFLHCYKLSFAPRVSTQVSNIPSIRLYTSLGFVLSESRYVLHTHG